MHKGDERRDRIASFVREYLWEHGELPTYRQIGAAVGLAKATVAYHLGELRAAGLITQRWEPVPQLARR